MEQAPVTAAPAAPTTATTQQQSNQPYQTAGAYNQAEQQNTATKTAADPAKQQDVIEIPVDGKVRRYTMDELKAKASLGESAYQRFEEAARMAKETQALKQKMSSPEGFIEAALESGASKEQIRNAIEQYYKREFIDPEVMSPEERELTELRRWKEAQTTQEQQRQEQQKQQQQQQIEQQTRVQLQQEIIATLEKSGLEKTRFNANRVAYWKRLNLDKGFDAPEDVIIDQVKNERKGIVSSFIQEASPEQLVELLGEDAVKKLRKFDLSRLKSRFQQQSEEPQTKAQQRQRKTSTDVDNYFNQLRRSKRT